MENKPRHQFYQCKLYPSSLSLIGWLHLAVLVAPLLLLVGWRVDFSQVEPTLEGVSSALQHVCSRLLGAAWWGVGAGCG